MKNRPLFTVFRLTILVAFSVTIGCSQNVSLRGKVTFSDDDAPLSTGAVCFESETMVARGELQADGSYVVGSDAPKNGLPPGEYRVYITGASKFETKSMGAIALPGTPAPSISIPVSLIDPKFSSPTTSGLTLKVERATGRFDFKVDRPPTK